MPIVADAGTARPELPADPRELVTSLAAAGPEERAAALREAGDGYLREGAADPEAALYCYRRFLEDADPSESRAPRGDDSWLLLYLKLARPTE
jgi:hypothetical protein